MTHEKCPLCGASECLVEEDHSGPPAVRYWCHQHCGTFRIGARFLKHVWPLVKQEDKRTIATYMHATKGPQRAAPLIQGDNYMKYVTQGRQLQKTASAERTAVTT